MMSAFYRISFAVSVIVMTSMFNIGESSSEEIDVLVKALGSSNMQTSMGAIEKMGRIRDERVVDALMEFVSTREEDWRIKIRGIRLLGEMADPRSSEVLIKLLTDV